jgi:hypothetical protein
MGRTHGIRRGTRYMFARDFRKRGSFGITKYLTTYKVGEMVDVKVGLIPHSFLVVLPARDCAASNTCTVHVPRGSAGGRLCPVKVGRVNTMIKASSIEEFRTTCRADCF